VELLESSSWRGSDWFPNPDNHPAYPGQNLDRFCHAALGIEQDRITGILDGFRVISTVNIQLCSRDVKRRIFRSAMIAFWYSAKAWVYFPSDARFSAEAE
jgi:hypothetical protein